MSKAGIAFGQDATPLLPAALPFGVAAALSPHTPGFRGVGGVIVGALGMHLAWLTLANVDIGDPTARHVLSRFWPQAYLWCFALAATAGHRLLGVLARWPWLRVCLRLAILAMAGAALHKGFRHHQSRPPGVAEDYLRAVLGSLPHGAILFTQGDTPMYVAKYLVEVASVRPDVTLVEADMLPGDWYVREKLPSQRPGLGFMGEPPPQQQRLAAILETLFRNDSNAEVFAVPDLKGHEQAIRGRFELVPFGLCKRIRPVKPRTPGRWKQDQQDSAAAWHSGGGMHLVEKWGLGGAAECPAMGRGTVQLPGG
ncbi:hypothetical protein T484DRAFT_1914080, partial [Baffinella frigidus]